MSANEVLVARFWHHTEKSNEGCWEWTGPKGNGYGRLYLGNKKPPRYCQAHRFAYELLVGPIPAGLVLDHLCRNHSCVNPTHLEPVTDAVNVMRGEGACARNSRKTHCHNGHEYMPETTYITARGWRECRVCKNARQLAYLRRKAA